MAKPEPRTYILVDFMPNGDETIKEQIEYETEPAPDDEVNVTAFFPKHVSQISNDPKLDFQISFEEQTTYRMRKVNFEFVWR